MCARLIILFILPLMLFCAGTAGAAQYYIAIAVGSGGTVSPQKGKLLVEGGESPAVTYTANAGYYLGEVKVNKVAVPITNRKVFTYQFNNVQKNYTIAAKFLKDPVITAKGSKGGTVTPSGKLFVPYSTSQSFTFAPQPGYHLASVVADRVNQGTPDSYTFDYVKTKHTLSVKFDINTYSVTTQAGDGGFIAPASLPAVKHGQSKVFTIKPNSGMQVASVTVNGTPVAGPLPPSGPYRLALTITGETVIAASFKEISISGLQKLAGTYHLADDWNSFWQDTNSGNISENVSGEAITATFDGKGGCNISVVGSSFTKSVQDGNETVIVDKSGSPSSCSYTVGDDGAFTLNLASSEGTDTVSGWVSTDGNAVIIGGYQQSSGTGWHEYAAHTISGVKAGSGISKATAAGTYHLVSRDTTLWQSKPQQDGKTHVSDQYGGNSITVTFDAAGGCTIQENGLEFSKQKDNVGNEFVDVSPWSGSPTSCSYTISSSGTFTLTITDSDGTFKVTGWSSADGNTVVFGGATQRTETDGTGYSAEHIFGVREGSGMGVASVNGTYRIVGSDFSFVQHLSNGTSFVGRVLDGLKATATFDGAGQCTVSFNGEGYFRNKVNNVETVQVESDSGTMSACSYAIGADGAFTLNMTGQGGNETITGRVSADGSTILIGGPSQKVDDSNNNHYEVTLMVGTKVK